MDVRTLASSPNISIATTTARLTPTPPSATKFGDVLANTAVQSAESAMTALPGGPMMALAVRGGAASVPLGTSTAALSTNTGFGAPAGTPFGSATGIGGLGGAGATGSTSAAGPVAAGTSTGTGAGMDSSSIESSMQQSADMNMYMLQVQQQVQQQSQQFTTLSNVMKAQYDTVKNAIGNIR